MTVSNITGGGRDYLQALGYMRRSKNLTAPLYVEECKNQKNLYQEGFTNSYSVLCVEGQRNQITLFYMG